MIPNLEYGKTLTKTWRYSILSRKNNFVIQKVSVIEMAS